MQKCECFVPRCAYCHLLKNVIEELIVIGKKNEAIIAAMNEWIDEDTREKIEKMAKSYTGCGE